MKAKIAAKKAEREAAAKAAGGAKAAPKAKAKEADAEVDEAAAAAEAEAKAKKEAEEKAKKAAEAKAKKEAEAKAAAEKAAKEKAEAIALFNDASCVLVKTAAANPAPATVNEKADALRAQGIAEASIQAAMKECGVKEVEYMRDAWGRIVALNDVKYNPNSKPPKADGFGQMRPRDD